MAFEFLSGYNVSHQQDCCDEHIEVGMDGAIRLEDVGSLTELERMQALGTSPFEAGYEAALQFGEVMVSGGGLYKLMLEDSGVIAGVMLGLDFKKGEVMGFSAMPLRPDMDVTAIQELMLSKFPMVAHVFEGIEKATGDQAGARGKDFLLIALRTKDVVGISRSEVDVENSKIIKGKMSYPKSLGEKLGLPDPVRH